MANTRIIKSVTKAAQSAPPPLPWTRGKRRAAFIAKRQSLVVRVKSA